MPSLPLIPGGGGDYNDMYSVVQTLGQLGL